MNKLIVAAFRCALMFVLPVLAYADSAQWILNPISGDWNTAANWTPMTIPNGPGDTATFDLSNTTNVSISANTEVNSITFTSGARAYTITAINGTLTGALTLSGTGIANNSGVIQNFVTYPPGGGNWGIVFTNSATASSLPAFTNSAATLSGTGGGSMLFRNTSSAASGTFTNNGCTVSGSGAAGGATVFSDSSTASNGTFTNNGGTGDLTGGGQTRFFVSSTADHGTFIDNGGLNGGSSGETDFFNSSSAGSATFTTIGGGGTDFFDTSSGGSGTFTANGGGTQFYDSSTADSATLIANAGPNGLYGGTSFFGDSTGGTSRIGVFGRAYLDIFSHNAPGVTIGSIEGDDGGLVFLAANTLTVGSNNLSSTFSGVIEDFGFGGSLAKIGDGTLILSGANTYTGNTNVNGGVLQIDGSIASNTFVNDDGTLAGSGTVNGAVTNNDTGTVSPGDALGVPGVLTIARNYTEAPTATLLIQIGGANAGQFSVLNVQGNASLNGFLDPVLVNGFVPAIGQSFTFMNYASFTGFFPRIENLVFDHGRKRWLVAYNPTSAVLIVVGNGPSPRPQ